MRGHSNSSGSGAEGPSSSPSPSPSSSSAQVSRINHHHTRMLHRHIEEHVSVIRLASASPGILVSLRLLPQADQRNGRAVGIKDFKPCQPPTNFFLFDKDFKPCGKWIRSFQSHCRCSSLLLCCSVELPSKQYHLTSKFSERRPLASSQTPAEIPIYNAAGNRVEREPFGMTDRAGCPWRRNWDNDQVVTASIPGRICRTPSSCLGPPGFYL